MEMFRTAVLGGAALLTGAACGQPTDNTVPLPAATYATEAAEAAELLYLAELRRAAMSSTINGDPDGEDTILVVTERQSEVVCRWRQRNGSNFRERQCKTRFQAEREEQQTAYALRRLRGF